MISCTQPLQVRMGLPQRRTVSRSQWCCRECRGLTLLDLGSWLGGFGCQVVTTGGTTARKASASPAFRSRFWVLCESRTPIAARVDACPPPCLTHAAASHAPPLPDTLRHSSCWPT